MEVPNGNTLHTSRDQQFIPADPGKEVYRLNSRR
jgi:hypothetical protein